VQRSKGEALRRISEGAAMIRTKGEAGAGNMVEAVRAHAGSNGWHPHTGKRASGRADDSS